MGKKTNPERTNEVLRMQAEGLGRNEIAKRLGMGKNTVSRILREETGKPLDAKTTEDAEVKRIETGKGLEVLYCGEEWMDPPDLVAYLGIDTDVWRLLRVETRGWEVTGRKKNGQVPITLVDGEGNETQRLGWQAETLWKSKNRYIKLVFERTAPRQIQNAIDGLIKRVHWPDPPPVHEFVKRTHFAEMSLYDWHLGKYAWAPLTGQDGDIKLSLYAFANAVDDMIAKAAPYLIDHIIFPIGHDFFQVDNWLGTTSQGTLVESTDTRFTKVFEYGVDAMRYAIDRCLEIGTVECLYVPGNHDQSTAFYLCKCLQYAYESNKHVTVDTSREEGHRGNRKYRQRGRCLFGYGHGQAKDFPSDDKLGLLMAHECQRTGWAKSVDMSWRLGHKHTKATHIFPILNHFNGVRIERLPSLSATDKWHFDNGFVGNPRSAEFWLWSYENGYEGQFPTYVDTGERDV